MHFKDRTSAKCDGDQPFDRHPRLHRLVRWSQQRAVSYLPPHVDRWRRFGFDHACRANDGSVGRGRIAARHSDRRGHAQQIDRSSLWDHDCVGHCFWPPSGICPRFNVPDVCTNFRIGRRGDPGHKLFRAAYNFIPLAISHSGSIVRCCLCCCMVDSEHRPFVFPCQY